MAEQKIVTTTTTPNATDYSAEKARLMEEITQKVASYNEAMQLGEFRTMKRLDDELRTAIKDYTSFAEKECFDALLEAKNPMVAAAVILAFPTVKIKDDKDADTGEVTRIITDVQKSIDPLRLHKRAKDGIGAVRNWSHMVELFNYALTARQSEQLGIPAAGIRDCYAMSKIARELECFKLTGEGIDPTSDDALREDLQTLVDAMLGEGFELEKKIIKDANGEEKEIYPDVNYLVTIYSKKGRGALEVACANHKYLRLYILGICHKLVTGDGYTVTYKKEKQE